METEKKPLVDPAGKTLLTPDQLCDALEVHLGRSKGRKACRELMDRMRDDPAWRAELNTLGCTVKLFQRIEEKDVPEDVQYRLMTVLNLGGEEGECGDPVQD